MKKLIVGLMMVVMVGMVGCDVRVKFKNSNKENLKTTWGYHIEHVQISPFEMESILTVDDKSIEIGFRKDGVIVWRYLQTTLTIPNAPGYDVGND